MAETLLTLEQILQATDGVHVLGGGTFCFDSVQTDSRSVVENTLFIPLIGEVQDGHKYIPQAIEKGASVVFIAMKNYESDPNFFVEIHQKNPDVYFIAVENTLSALQRAAARYVEKFPSLLKVGVTGSSGKTTTKEILASILAQKFNVITNKGNLNSETGLPLSVFNIRPEHTCGIFEMGMNRVDEIGEIASVLKPNYAIVTNIGTAHIGLLGSRQNIASEKAKVFSHFDSNGVGVIPFDDDFAEFLESKIRGKVVKYGTDTPTVKYVADLGLDGTKFTVGGNETVLSLPGKYNYKNALGAIALSEELGLSSEEIARGISALKPMFGRSEVIRGKYTIIQDCYNANPDSMEKSIEFISSVSTDAKKVLVLGDMLELGDDSRVAHETAGTLASGAGASIVAFVGKEMKAALDKFNSSSSDAKVLYTEKHDDQSISQLAESLKKMIPESSIVLIKGSRGIGLERVTKILNGGCDD